MSWKTVNAVLGLAIVNREFRRALLANPLAAVQAQRFDLTAEEKEAFKLINATNLSKFSQQLIVLLDKKSESSDPAEGG